MPTPYFYKRKLPHWQPAEETFFITYRLAGSLPTVTAALKEKFSKKTQHHDNQTSERKEIIRQDHFIAFENELDK